MLASLPLKSLFGVCCALLLFGVPSRAAATIVAAPVAPAIIGVVVDTAGTPLANAHVLVPEVGRTTTTNAVGQFVLRGLPAGEYHLSITIAGYAPGHLVVRVPAEGEDLHVRVVLRWTPMRLSAVVVSASPTGTETERLTQAALELSGRALARSIGSSISASLASEPGVSQRFAGPTAGMPVIRGLTGDRVIMLQDGERLGDLAASASDHAMSVDPLSAQRIEVVRGPASLLYGNSALGGVVNVVSNDIPTAVPTHLEGFVGAQTASATPGGAVSGRLSTALGTRGAVSLRAGFRDMASLRTGGGVDLAGTDSRSVNATLGYGFVGERGTFGLAVRTYDFAYGIAADAGDPEAGVRISGVRSGVSARGGVQPGLDVLPYVRVEGSAQWYTHDEIEPSGEIGTTFDLQTQTFNTQATTAIGRMKGAIGVQALFKQYHPTGDEALTPAANSTGLGAFLFQELPLRSDVDHERSPTLQVGARWDDYRIASIADAVKFGPAVNTEFSNLSGSLGVSVPVGSVVTLSGSIARAFRAPTVEELFSDGFHPGAGSYDVGNRDLTSETSAGAEAIVRVRTDRVTAQFSAYRNQVNGYVAPNAVGDTLVDGDLVPLIRYRQADAVLQGVEGSVELHLLSSLVVSAMGDLVRGEFRSGGGPLSFMPPARLGGGVRWETHRVTLGGEVRHGFAQDRVTGGGVDVPTASYTLLNLSAGRSWLVGNVMHQVTLRADNVTDERYFDAASRVKRFAANSGRNLSLIYQVQF